MTVAGTQTTAWPQLQSCALVATMVNQMVAGYQQSWLEQTGEQIVLAPSNRIYHHILSIAAFLENAYEQLD